MKYVAGILGALALLAPAANAAADTPGHAGRWITDGSGRVLVLHGVNMVSKRPPYTPSAAGFGSDDIKFLKDRGFNTVRLGVIYKGLEPQPGVYNRAYLDRIVSTQQKLAKAGIYSLIDFHQDLYNERFQGEGWPDWAVQDDGLPAQPAIGFPGNYLAMPALNRAFDHFWANDPGPGGAGLQDRYAAAWRQVAARFRRLPGVLGYDILNEPWPGLAYPTCLSNLGCPLFDGGQLSDFNSRVIHQIRRADTRHLVWPEPLLTFDFGADTSMKDSGDARTGFNFHDYCLPGGLGLPLPPSEACSTFEELPFTNADDRVRTTGDALLLSEFGATADLPTIGRVVGFADKHMVSWQYWHYCSCDDPTTQTPGAAQSLVIDAHKAPTGSNVISGKLHVLGRPYPRVVAGTPTSWSFDPASASFVLEYTTAKAAGGGRFRRGISQVSVPRYQYRGGYRVSVRGARVLSERNAKTLELRSYRRAKSVRVIVKPR